MVMSRQPGYTSRTVASTMRFDRIPRHDLFETVRILRVERATLLGVDVQNGDNLFPRIEHRHDHFRLRSGVARNMARKPINVRHNQSPTLGCRCPAHPLSERDLQAAE